MDSYQTESSTTQITILLDESFIEELTSWLGSNWQQEQKFSIRSEEILYSKQKAYRKVIVIMIFSDRLLVSFIDHYNKYLPGSVYNGVLFIIHHLDF